MGKKDSPDPAARAYLASIGRKGGKARTARLSPRQRKELAQRAARARWKKRRKG